MPIQPAQLEQVIDERLAALKQNMMTQKGIPIFLIGYDGDNTKGRYVIGWAAGEKPNLSECHALLSSMLEEVAAQLGVL